MSSNQSNSGSFSNSIPDNWSKISLLEADLEIEDGDRGKNYPKRSELTPVGYCPFLNNKNVIGDKINLDEVDFISEEKDNLLRKGRVRINDIILTTRGSVGNVGLFTDEYPFKFARINSGMVIIRNNDKTFNLNFLYQLLKSPFMKSQYQSLSSGTAQPQLPIRDIKKLDLIVPPKDEQFRIAKLLDFLDSKIELNNQINQTLEEMAQTIFKHWFVDFEFPNGNGEPYKSSGGKFVESELGMIPEGWKAGVISDIGEVIGGGTPSRKKEDYFTDFGIPWITPKDLSNSTNKFINRGAIDITEEGYKNSSVRKLPKGSVLFSSRAPIGYIAIAKNEVTTNQGFKSIIPNSKIGNEFVYQLLKQNLELIENRASGSTFKEISGWALKEVPIIIPSEYIIKRYSDIVQSYNHLILSNEEQTGILISLRDALLPKLMSGEIRIPDAEQEVEACLQKSN